MEEWAPPPLAWEKDNIGLLVGSASSAVKRILVALDVSTEVVAEAKKKKADLIVAHHPLIFRSLRSLTDRSRVGRLVTELVRARISVYAAHTNLDFTNNGVSAALARKLGIQDVRPLQKDITPYEKITTFVPREHTDRVMRAMGAAGAGMIGNYDLASFSGEGEGTFRPLTNAGPYIGKMNVLEKVRENRLEMIAPRWKTADVLAAMRKAHPYEEVAFDVVKLVNENSPYGAGVIGELRKPVKLSTFLGTVRSSLKARGVRYSGNRSSTISRVAACGGSGSDLTGEAVRQGADAFVTADVKYHAFQDAADNLALIDAGHYETENPVVEAVVEYLNARCSGTASNVRIFASTSSRNPVFYYTS
jgi:dinuclear metal center YbgI/SA1388 family protein